jgi:hypothetical protein
VIAQVRKGESLRKPLHAVFKSGNDVYRNPSLKRIGTTDNGLYTDQCSFV